MREPAVAATNSLLELHGLWFGSHGGHGALLREKSYCRFGVRPTHFEQSLSL